MNQKSKSLIILILMIFIWTNTSCGNGSSNNVETVIYEEETESSAVEELHEQTGVDIVEEAHKQAIIEEQAQPEEPIIVTIDTLSRNLDQYLGDFVQVDGYFGSGDYYGTSGNHYLVNDYEILLRNEYPPEHTILLLQGYYPVEYDSQHISMIGRVLDNAFVPDYPYYDNERVPLVEILEVIPSGNYYSPISLDDDNNIANHSSPIHISTQNLTHLYIPLKSSNPAKECKYAIIVSGGVNNFANNKRYWKNIVFINDYLTNKLGLTKENVHILYYLGADREGTAGITDASATAANVQAHFDQLSNHLRTSTSCQDTELMIFTTNHGHVNGLHLLGANILTHNQLKTIIDKFSREILDGFIRLRVNVFMEQCYSGGFVNTLKDSVDFITTAAQPNQTSHAWAPGLRGGYDEYLLHFVAGLYGTYPTDAKPFKLAGLDFPLGNLAKADVDNDHYVEWREASEFAKNANPYANNETVRSAGLTEDPITYGYGYSITETTTDSYIYTYEIHNLGDKEISAVEIIFPDGTNATGAFYRIIHPPKWEFNSNRNIVTLEAPPGGLFIEKGQIYEISLYSEYSPLLYSVEIRVGWGLGMRKGYERHYSASIPIEGPDITP